MLKLENTGVFGWEATIRGMRNPMNSWNKSDSGWGFVPSQTCPICDRYECGYIIGENDLKLMKSLSKAGNDHAKFLRMINVTVDITAPLYWWKEYDTYKVGTVANSCSTMHKIADKEFTLEDFSCEHLTVESITFGLEPVIDILNKNRELYIQWENAGEEKKNLWWQMIQLLPSSYNQKRTVQFNYQVLKQMYFARKDHKLDEWHTLCDWMLTLPYFKEVCVDVIMREGTEND
jgi:hypothetical protein